MLSVEFKLQTEIEVLKRRVRDLERSIGRASLGSIGGTTDYSVFAFGFSISGAVVTVKAGKVRHGKQMPIVVAQTAITINEDQTWIYCVYVMGSGVATIASSLTEPIPTPTTLKYPLHLWGVATGAVSVKSILHLGDVILPGNFA